MTPLKVTSVILTLLLSVNAQVSGTGTTTRYWDCCKASCGWIGKTSIAYGSTPVRSCDRNDNPITDMDARSGCVNGGPAYMCSDQTPWAVSEKMSYGFAATTISGGTEASWCCACYQLTFTSGAVAGKQMIVQATNTGGDLGSNQFDLAMPGGGFGIFNGCSTEWGNPPLGWGAQYGGVSSRAMCDGFPAKLKAGCYWRWDWFGGSDNPKVSFQQVTCPAALTAKSGCVRNGETPTGPAIVPTWTPGSSSTTTSKSSSTITTSTSTTSSTKSTTTSSAAVPTGTGVAARWGQCGGIGYSGPTVCVAGTTCVYSSPYYSQCL